MTQGGRYVINEWLWADLAGENRAERQREAVRFLFALRDRPDQIVVVRGSAFDQKAWGFCRFADVVRRGVSKLFMDLRFDSRKCLSLDLEELERVPPDLAAAANRDDYYLIQAILSVPGATLITTDLPLNELLVRAGVKCELRDPFLRDYLGRGNPS